MPVRRRTRCMTVLLALVSLLFMQLALARYVCPGVRAQLTSAAGAPQSGVPCAEPMSTVADNEQPNLCKAHCEDVNMSAETVKVPTMVMPDGLVAYFLADPARPILPDGLPLQRALLQRSTAPPLTIRHCCFRI